MSPAGALRNLHPFLLVVNSHIHNIAGGVLLPEWFYFHIS